MELVKHFSVIIIGAGPAGVGAAVALSKSGVNSVAVLERNNKIGGISSLYKKKKGGVRTFVRWSKGGIPVSGAEYADWLERILFKTAVQVKTESQVIDIDAIKKMVTYVNPAEGKVRITADAVIMACGSREKNQAERGWISGSRPARVLFTKQLLGLLNEQSILPFKHPVILGSDVLAYAVAAKLTHAGASEPIIIDQFSSPRCSFAERFFFRAWTNPFYRSTNLESVEIAGDQIVTGVRFGGATIPCDGLMICGDLIPNTELVMQGKLKADAVTRIPFVNRDFGLSQPGWFAAGNILGGFHGAEWCYFNGFRTARQLVKNRNL